MEIIIGTAQFGMKYGISNSDGKVTLDEAARIVSVGNEHFVRHFDTAPGYGNSELVLGEILDANSVITTKVSPRTERDSCAKKWIVDCVNKSRSNLRRNTIDELLFHRSSDLISEFPDVMADVILDLKSSGLIKKIGVSVYDFNDMDYLLDNFQIDIIQIPYNLIDRRLVSRDWITRLKAKNIRVDVRSGFLQGLLLQNSIDRNPYFDQWSNLWDRFQIWQDEHPEISKIEVCLQFIKQTKLIDSLVIGTQAVKEFQEVLKIFENEQIMDFPNIESNDERLINPSRWCI